MYWIDLDAWNKLQAEDYERTVAYTEQDDAKLKTDNESGFSTPNIKAFIAEFSTESDTPEVIKTETLDDLVSISTNELSPDVGDDGLWSSDDMEDAEWN